MEIQSTESSIDRANLLRQADEILAQAGYDPLTGRKKAELPKNYFYQRRFEKKIKTGAYCSRRRK